MGDEHDGLLHLGLQAQELVLQAVTGDRVDRAEGLVHEHHRRVGRQRACDADALRLATRQLLGIAVAVLGRVESDEVEQLVGACAGALRVPAEQAGDRAHVLGDRLMGEQPDALDDVADASAQLVGVDVGDVLAVEDDAAGRRFDHAVDETQRRRLPAA